MAERLEFRDLLQKKWGEGKSLCIGLDPDYTKIKQSDFCKQNTLTQKFLFNEFLKPIIDATADVAAAYKPNIAFYEFGEEGEKTLQKTTEYILKKYPETPIIGDIKRADIGNTNKGYAEMAFKRFCFDAVTTNPYFGQDTYEAFLEYSGKGLFVLCKTSNKYASFFQDVLFDIDMYQEDQIKNSGIPLTEKELKLAKDTAYEYNPRPETKVDFIDEDHFKTTERLKHSDKYLTLYQLVALRTASLAKEYRNIGLVAGATHPEPLASIRMLAPNLTLLIPGIGRQGGNLEKTIKVARDKNNQGFIINSSCAIIFASKGRDFAEAARLEALKLHNQITQIIDF